MTVEQLAQMLPVLHDVAFLEGDPTRRQLVEQAQTAGVTLRPVIEVEDMEAALQLVARGLGGYRRRACGAAHDAGLRSLHVAPFVEPMWETFAFIARRDAPISPATRAMVEIVERRLERLGESSSGAGAMSGTDR